LKILSFESLPSTQLYLKALLKDRTLEVPLAVIAHEQTEGIGSRNNSWSSQKGNLFVSFALALEELPQDLKLESASIYFSQILKDTLASFGSKVIVKWPNDLYLESKKVAGMITNIVGDKLVCGIGVNLQKHSDEFGYLDVEVDKNNLLKKYFANIEKKLSWKQVFSKYKLEFQINKNYFTHINGEKVSLSEAELENDGSLNINGKKVYSLR